MKCTTQNYAQLRLTFGIGEIDLFATTTKIIRESWANNVLGIVPQIVGIHTLETSDTVSVPGWQVVCTKVWKSKESLTCLV